MTFKISPMEGLWARGISIFVGGIEYENPSILMQVECQVVPA